MEIHRENASSADDWQSCCYPCEITQRQASISDTYVIVQMDNSWSLDMDDIIADVKAQYDNTAKRSWADAESWYYSKVSHDGHSQKQLCPTSAMGSASSDFPVWVE